jgi:hypothetical protein
MPLNDRKKSKLTVLEKTAIVIILLILLVIILLVFNKQIIEAYEAFRAWYGSV